MKYLLIYYFLQVPTGIDSSRVNIPQSNPDSILSGVLTVVYTLTGAIAVIMLIISGYMYVMSGGNAETVKKAKNGILYSVIGIIVIVSAFTITQFVTGRV